MCLRIWRTCACKHDFPTPTLQECTKAKNLVLVTLYIYPHLVKIGHPNTKIEHDKQVNARPVGGYRISFGFTIMDGFRLSHWSQSRNLVLTSQRNNSNSNKPHLHRNNSHSGNNAHSNILQRNNSKRIKGL